jgi:hypothetical protein
MSFDEAIKFTLDGEKGVACLCGYLSTSLASKIG